MLLRPVPGGGSSATARETVRDVLGDTSYYLANESDPGNESLNFYEEDHKDGDQDMHETESKHTDQQNRNRIPDFAKNNWFDDDWWVEPDGKHPHDDITWFDEDWWQDHQEEYDYQLGQEKADAAHCCIRSGSDSANIRAGR